MIQTGSGYQPRLKQLYHQKLRKELCKELKLDNIHQVPELEKIVLNAGLGRVKNDKNALLVAANTLAKISGQKPQTTLARLSIASFQLRTGHRTGLMVTLRDARMYEFLERLICLVMPRFRDFRGASLKSFDQSGNYSLGFAEQSLFPELSFAETSPSHGLQATIVFANSSCAKNNRKLLQAFGFKFEKEAKKD